MSWEKKHMLANNLSQSSRKAQGVENAFNPLPVQLSIYPMLPPENYALTDMSRKTLYLVCSSLKSEFNFLFLSRWNLDSVLILHYIFTVGIMSDSPDSGVADIEVHSEDMKSKVTIGSSSAPTSKNYIL